MDNVVSVAHLKHKCKYTCTYPLIPMDDVGSVAHFKDRVCKYSCTHPLILMDDDGYLVHLGYKCKYTCTNINTYLLQV